MILALSPEATEVNEISIQINVVLGNSSKLSEPLRVQSMNQVHGNR